MPYIHFTEEQKLRANAANLVEFLRFKGEPLIREGSEYRLSSNHRIGGEGKSTERERKCVIKLVSGNIGTRPD